MSFRMKQRDPSRHFIAPPCHSGQAIEAVAGSPAHTAITRVDQRDASNWKWSLHPGRSKRTGGQLGGIALRGGAALQNDRDRMGVNARAFGGRAVESKPEKIPVRCSTNRRLRNPTSTTSNLTLTRREQEQEQDKNKNNK